MNEDIARLQISMDYVGGVKISNSKYELDEPFANFIFGDIGILVAQVLRKVFFLTILVYDVEAVVFGE